ncbi:tyrosine-type recombinase/integrase [Sphingomonas sp.]|uniref:tyrosine-type recombinase/integrase n=1 Tax=Sphingomonas sp. TaxID=28214 RepID=UPI003F71BED3
MKFLGPLGPAVSRKIWIKTWDVMCDYRTRKATWSEFDLDKAVWSIPAARRKIKEAHVVPLAPAAVKLLRSNHRRHLELHGTVSLDELLFSVSRGKPISDMTMLKVLRDTNITDATVHGFRSTFTD